MTLEGYGEDRLVRELCGKIRCRDASVVVGPGDDCAVVRVKCAKHDLLLKTDAMVEGVHFDVATDPRLVGRKALCRTLSDVAAMGGRPCHALITLALPPEKPVAWARDLYTGVQRTARKYGVTIVGGETSRSLGGVFISVAMTGKIGRGEAILRSGGQNGDSILVTGRLGGSIRGWHLRFQPRIEEARWLARHFKINAMMDLSDGLAADLPRLAAASGLHYELEPARLPRRQGASIEQALNDGEDYELLFTVWQDQVAELQQRWREKFPRLLLSAVGHLTRRRPAVKTTGGFHHF